MRYFKISFGRLATIFAVSKRNMTAFDRDYSDLKGLEQEELNPRMAKLLSAVDSDVPLDRFKVSERNYIWLRLWLER